MQLLSGPRHSGKTTELIKLAARDGGYIVCRSKSMAGQIMDMARGLEVRIAFPITYEEFLSKKYYSLGCRRFYIDDADALLQSLTAVPIEVITFTGGVK